MAAPRWRARPPVQTGSRLAHLLVRVPAPVCAGILPTSPELRLIRPELRDRVVGELIVDDLAQVDLARHVPVGGKPVLRGGNGGGVRAAVGVDGRPGHYVVERAIPQHIVLLEDGDDILATGAFRSRGL